MCDPHVIEEIVPIKALISIDTQIISVTTEVLI